MRTERRTSTPFLVTKNAFASVKNTISTWFTKILPSTAIIKPANQFRTPCVTRTKTSFSKIPSDNFQRKKIRNLNTPTLLQLRQQQKNFLMRLNETALETGSSTTPSCATSLNENLDKLVQDSNPFVISTPSQFHKHSTTECNKNFRYLS